MTGTDQALLATVLLLMTVVIVVLAILVQQQSHRVDVLANEALSNRQHITRQIEMYEAMIGWKRRVEDRFDNIERLTGIVVTAESDPDLYGVMMEALEMGHAVRTVNREDDL